MQFTINDIIKTAELRTRLLSGSGLERPVRWAHVCELDDPTEWLGEGDLLMTTGLAIPSTPEAQRCYLERLVSAELAGLMIGEHMQAPDNLQALCETADTLNFPILLTHYGVPFAAVTHAIVEANRQQDFERRNLITQIYENARLGLQGLGLSRLISRLEKDTRATLSLLESNSLEPWLPSLKRLEVDQLILLQHKRSKTPRQQWIIQRYRLNESRQLMLMEIPSQRNCLLVANSDGLLDYSLLHHVVAVLGIELERLQVEHERQLRLGSELLDDLLQHRLSPRLLEQRLAQFDITLEQAQLAVTSLANDPDFSDILLRRGIMPLCRVQGEELIFLVEQSQAIELQHQLGGPMGLSNILEHPERATEALREARLAHSCATPEAPFQQYAHSDLTPWQPRNLDEARQVFQQVLGRLAEHDVQQGSQLLMSLRTFLEHNRSWLGAAQQLHIHKQTLVYRIRRIEAITGRSLSNTEDVAILWFALRAGSLASINLNAPRL
ncbi:PucR family transcriptional regulator [Oceanimonas baumannii]|uniref:PucR family transcriptional regulator n=1 Tax=Oceanimonas baumannii TaxID=129578 RepID=A0A235CFR9_9GAMM|nr:PucR family transcriptional regulator [Oceanimonas baumannii]OYD22675.1 PucR family transcriptional regulator [Oceanimonas baumannii]TDW57563.1 purine catabolism regulator [Oceanimonas baumannii]